jgi:catechol 2,3-dioxygenase-like lactoylglutathione lyase family enzyme
VSDFSKAMAFYEAALSPLGLTPLVGEEGVYYGFGKDKPFFWISMGDGPSAPTRDAHIALSANSAKEVDAFYAAALLQGGRDNGAPGPREHYHPGYYGAFVFDHDGNNIEAVFHGNKREV